MKIRPTKGAGFALAIVAIVVIVLWPVVNQGTRWVDKLFKPVCEAIIP